jgi:ribosomal protein L7/L12
MAFEQEIYSLQDRVLELGGRVVELENQVRFLYSKLGITYVASPEPLDDSKIIEQIRKGNMIEAIKIHRATYNTSLLDAKKAVEELRAQVGG